MQLRNSPLARSPPPNMAKIPGITDFDPESTNKQAAKENGVIKEDPKEGIMLLKICL